ncbi:hypothetical protein WN982_40795 [Paraburkholderia sp. IMGN_8]|uniref:hypothetical protein n=1 Tax=Paraburkholderia sp. IMGN_8 TaxID=3136564 RepID=UPI003100FA6E
MQAIVQKAAPSQKQLSSSDVDAQLMRSIQNYLASIDHIDHVASFFVDPYELLINEEVLPDDCCVLVALHTKSATEFPETTTNASCMVITTPSDQRFATLLLRGDKIALPDHAFAAWNAPQPRRLLVVYLFSDAILLEKISLDDELIENLSVCGIVAQSGNHLTYAELQAEADDASWETTPLRILDNRHIETIDAENVEASA